MSRGFLAVAVCVSVFLALVLCLAVPGSRAYRWYRAEQTVAELTEQVSRLEDEKLEQQRSLAKWYNFCLATDAARTDYQGAYGEILDIGQGMMGYLELPSLGLSVPLYHRTGVQEMPSAGHVPGTAMPIGGLGNHTVLVAPETVAKLQVGDVFCLHVLRQTLYYRIREVQCVTPGNTGGLSAVEGEDLCSLTAVVNQGKEKYRLQAIRIEDGEARAVLRRYQQPSPRAQWALGVALRAAVVTLFLPCVTGGLGSAIRWRQKHGT